MNIHTRLEDLSNEIFFEIFDHLNAFQILTGFTSLNQRISSILHSIPFRIIISKDYFYDQVDFLSSHLTYHADQVIALLIYDTICDYSSVINLLFDRHNFINLESCILYSINPLTKFENVIKKIENSDRLVKFNLIDQYDDMDKENKCDLTRLILTHKSPFLCSVTLLYNYDYFDISNYTSISSNIKTLYLRIRKPSISLHFLLIIFRLCHQIRHLSVRIENEPAFENVSYPQLYLNDDNHSLLPQLVSFNFIMLIQCDIESIAYILHCMPNLKHFYLLLQFDIKGLPYYLRLFDGYIWQKILTYFVPCLSKFEFHISIYKTRSILNFNYIVKSFQYFVEKYPNWNMVIDRCRISDQISELTVLRTLNYPKYAQSNQIYVPLSINSESYETQSTLTINDHHLFYTDIINLTVNLSSTNSTINWSSPLYKNVYYLQVQMPIIPLWNQFLNMITFYQTNIDDAQRNLNYLSHFANLSDISALRFSSETSVYQWKSIQLILESCTNLTHITISIRLLMLSKLIDNPSLIKIFKQIRSIKSITDEFDLSWDFLLNFVQRFSSLITIELQVLSFENCINIINVFLTYLENLSYIKIYYCRKSLINDPFTCNYIMEKRRRNFHIDENKVKVINNDDVIEIFLLK